MMNNDSNEIENTETIETQFEAEMLALQLKQLDQHTDGSDAGEVPDQQALADTNAIPGQEVGEASEKKEKAPAAYLAFMAAVAAAEDLGLNVKEQKGFFQVWSAGGHKIYVGKSSKERVRIDTTLPRSALIINGRDISLPLAKPNGRIVCHVDPTVEALKEALMVLASYSDKIRPARKPAPKTPPAI